ncbi:MAG TPA: beta-ketoacyl-[acyl-carrier-protein] synthase family protein, partial [Rhodocyclaceae bacterium]
RAARSGLARCAFETVDLPTWIGEVAGVDAQRLPAEFASFDCRNNRLAWLGLQQDGFVDAVRAAIARHGADRVGVFLGTSTAGILETEIAYRHRDPATGALPADFDYRRSHNTYSVGDFVRTAFGLRGPAAVVSTACSSSAKVFASASRAIAAGLIDAAIVGGVDSLCLTTLYGFNSLELCSPTPCRPFDATRDGISIGEAAAFILVEPAKPDDDAICLLGYGESSDAHHMSSPHPDGLGARLAIEAALRRAALAPADIDYVNLHGTATQSNDAAEDKAVYAVFADRVVASSTKGATGHTLGAAGGVEAIYAALAIENSFAPAGVNTTTIDPVLQTRYLLENRQMPVRHVVSNSFGFGGTNASLVIGRRRPA